MEPGAVQWLTQVHEDVVDLEQRIIDHHHVWPPGAVSCGLEEFFNADTSDGHRVEATGFTKCGAAYRGSGPGARRVPRSEVSARAVGSGADEPKHRSKPRFRGC